MLLAATAIGCGKKDPPLHPVSGKITLGGKTYPRILCYFRPVSEIGDNFNLGVGECDKDGKLFVRCGAGEGIKAGEYKVTFSCIVTQGGKSAAGDKPDDDRNARVVELVKPPHDTASEADTPVRFTVTAGGENFFQFDIPSKK